MYVVERKMKKYSKATSRFVFFATISALFLTPRLMAQDMVTGASVFTFKRPASSGATVKKPTYRVKAPLEQRKHPVKPAAGGSSQSTSKSNDLAISSAAFAANEQLGVTLWRLRPEQVGDNGARLLTMKGSTNDSSKMVAERVGLDTAFEKGEKVRISVESPRSGYLYIIDRELRKDATVGDAYLIFPTLKTRGGDNNVNAGKVIEVPAQTDKPFYFEITPSDENYAGELLTVIVSPVRIEGLQLKMDPIKLPASLVEKWETLWERMSTAFELETGRGLTYTEEEKEAGTGMRLLTQKSPAPQTLISVHAPKGKPFLISFPMKVSK